MGANPLHTKATQLRPGRGSQLFANTHFLFSGDGFFLVATLACAWAPVLGDETEDEDDEDDDEAEDEEDEEEDEEEEEEELLLELLELRERRLRLPTSRGCSSRLLSFCTGLGGLKRQIGRRKKRKIIIKANKISYVCLQGTKKLIKVFGQSLWKRLITSGHVD